MSPAEDPLGRLNGAFRPAYDRVRRELLERQRPVLFITGDQVVLLTAGGRRELRMAIPQEVDDLKAVAHLVVTCYLLLGFEPGGALSDGTRAEAGQLRAGIDQAREALAGRTLDATQRERQQVLLARAGELLDQALDSGRATRSQAVAFVRACRPLVDANTREAAALMLDVLHDGIGSLYAALSADEQQRLMVLNMGTKSARNGAQVVKYVAWLLGEQGEGTRIVFAEGARNEQEALDVLATFLADMQIGLCFGGHPLAFMRDVLGEPTDQLLRATPPTARSQRQEAG